jgi:hypothetical protein
MADQSSGGDGGDPAASRCTALSAKLRVLR